MAANIDIFLRLRQTGGAVIERVNQQLRKTRQNLENVREASATLVEAGTRATAFGVAVTAAAATPVKFAADFEKSMSGVKALLEGAIDDQGELEKAFTMLRGEALKLGETTQFTAVQASEAIQFLARAGFDADEIMASLGATLNLAAVENINLARSADIASNILTGFRKDASELTSVVDVLANVTTNSNVNLEQLGESLKTAGPNAAAAGIAFEEAAAAVGILGNAGLQGSRAGTGLRAIIRSLLNPSRESSKVIKRLGLEVTDASGNFVGLLKIIQQLEKRLPALGNNAEQTKALLEIFGEFGGPSVQALLGQGSKELEKLIDRAKRTGTAAQIAKTRLANLRGAFTRLTSAVSGFLIKVGTPLLGILTKIVDGITVVIGKLSEWYDLLGDAGPIILGIVGALGALLTLLGAVITVLGGIGLAIAGIKVGLAALGTVGVAAAGALLVVLGKIAAVLAVIAAAWAIGSWIADLQILGITVKDFVAFAILEFQKWFSFLTIKWLQFKQILAEIFTLGAADTDHITEQIKAEEDHIKALEEAQVQLLLTADTAEKAADRRIKASKKVEQQQKKENKITGVDPTEPKNLDVELSDQQVLEQREAALAKLIERTKTRIADLDERRRRGSLDAETILLARRRLNEAVLQEEKAILLERRRLAEGEQERAAAEIALVKKLEEAKRFKIAEDRKELELQDKLFERRKEVLAKLEELEKQTLTESISDLKRRQELELNELERRAEQEIKVLEDKEARVATINEAIALQEKRRNQLRIRQAQELVDAQRRIVEQLEDIEAETFGDDIAGIKAKNELELSQFKRAQKDRIDELRKAGATEQQIRTAQNLAIEATNQKRIDLEKEVLAKEEEINREREDKQAEMAEKQKQLTDQLFELRRRSADPDNQELQNQLELEAFDRRAKAEIERLEQLGATTEQIRDAQRAQEIEKERLHAAQIDAIWQQRLNTAKSIFGGLSQLFSEFAEATGKNNRALFIASKAFAVAEATINIAQGITKALAQGGPILGPIQAGVIAALGGVQIAKIVSQQLAAGGPIIGGSGRKDDVLIAAMGGEYMINKRATNYYTPSVMQAINTMQVDRNSLVNAIDGSVPQPHTPSDLAYRTGGLVPGQGQTSAAGQSPVTVVNVRGREEFDEWAASTAGQDSFLNVASARRDDFRAILLGDG